MFWMPAHDSSAWKYKGRHTVLGKWHQIKLELWEQHLGQCDMEATRKGDRDEIQCSGR